MHMFCKKVCFFALVLAFAMVFMAPTTGMSKEGPVVDTPRGKVRGFVKDGVNVFLGVPAGKPPYEKDTRFMPAQFVEPWSGIVDCTEFASWPLQAGKLNVDTSETSPDGQPVKKTKLVPKGGGDCLRMNIWAPTGNPGNCPVLVYIPGGGSVNCDPTAVNGTAFAKDGIVTVVVPYRVNVDGFMKIKGVPANLAIRDMIFDLQWVRDNIAAFGGDPNNVTVMGQSAGSTHIGSLLASPLAKGLFKRAILMSGSHLAQWTPEQADMASSLLEKHYGVPATKEDMMTVPFEKLLTFGQVAGKQLKDPDWMKYTNGNGTIFKPYVDGEVLPKRPVDAVADGASKDVDTLIGCTKEEWNYVTVPSGMIDSLGDKDIKFVLDSIDAPMSVAEEYKKNGRGKTHGEIYSAIESDIIFRVPTNRMIESRTRGGGNTWVYSFEERSPAYDGKLGAVHWYDIPFVFKMLDDKNNKRVQQYVGSNPPHTLADKMHNAWVNFIKHGNPGWNKYDADKRNIMIIDSKTWEEKNDPWKHERELIKLK